MGARFAPSALVAGVLGVLVACQLGDGGSFVGQADSHPGELRGSVGGVPEGFVGYQGLQEGSLGIIERRGWRRTHSGDEGDVWEGCL